MQRWNGGELFNRGLDNLLKGPGLNRKAYKSKYNSARLCVAVLGNERADKAGYLVEYCNANGLGNYVFGFEPAMTVSQNLDKCQEALNEVYSPPADDRTHVLILERADRMAYECDTMEAAAVVTRLDQWAAQMQLIVVCLIDRTPMQVRESGKHAQAFFKQFSDALLYFAPPSSAYIARYLRHHFEAFQDEYYATLRAHTTHKRELPLREALPEEAYTLLAEACRSASVGHVDDFVRSVCRALCAPHCPVETADDIRAFVCSPPFLKTTEYGHHILTNPKEVVQMETHWADTAGASTQEPESAQKKMKF